MINSCISDKQPFTVHYIRIVAKKLWNNLHILHVNFLQKKKSYPSTQISSLIPIDLMVRLSIELSSEQENNTVDGTHVSPPIQIRHWQIHHPTMTPHSSCMHCTPCYLFFLFFLFFFFSFFWMMQEICCPYFLNISKGAHFMACAII